VCLERGGHFFGTRREAEQHCRRQAQGFCCQDGRVVRSSEAECLERGGHFFGTRREAEQHCRERDAAEADRLWQNRLREIGDMVIDLPPEEFRRPFTLAIQAAPLLDLIHEFPYPLKLELLRGNRPIARLGEGERAGAFRWQQAIPRGDLILVKIPEIEFNNLANRADSGHFSVRMKVPKWGVAERFRLIDDELLQRLVDTTKAQNHPDVAVTQFKYQIINGGQYSVDLNLTGIVGNLHAAPFKYSGNIILYRGTEVRVKKPLGPLKSKQYLTINHTISERYNKKNGAKYHPDYILKIEYTKGIPATAKQIDWDYGNNQKKISQDTIYKQIYAIYTRKQLLILITQDRTRKGLGMLSMDSCMNKAAQGHSEWMDSTGNFSHTGQGGSSHSQRCAAAGCSCSAETIYSGSGPSGCFNAWKNSPGHNAIMLGSYTKIGIGVESGSYTAVYK
jgi:hypothetical protein